MHPFILMLLVIYIFCICDLHTRKHIHEHIDKNAHTNAYAHCFLSAMLICEFCAHFQGVLFLFLTQNETLTPQETNYSQAKMSGYGHGA